MYYRILAIRTESMRCLRERGERTAPCAGYCRASAMWSDDSFAGRASRALRKDLQNITSDMMGGCDGV